MIILMEVVFSGPIRPYEAGNGALPHVKRQVDDGRDFFFRQEIPSRVKKFFSRGVCGKFDDAS